MDDGEGEAEGRAALQSAVWQSNCGRFDVHFTVNPKALVLCFPRSSHPGTNNAVPLRRALLLSHLRANCTYRGS